MKINKAVIAMAAVEALAKEYLAEKARLSFVLTAMNESGDESEWWQCNVWNNLPGNNEDMQAEARAAIDRLLLKGCD